MIDFEGIIFNFAFFVLCSLFCKNAFVSTSVQSISKCHYEGDFSVSCKEPNELMRSANVINGLLYNDTQCSYNPKDSHCHRQTVLSYCIDKSSCAIKNDWFSLQPQCGGNSYYTQFNFDCQPAYHMCEDTVVKDAFSGVIYSPFYPHSFRTESSQPCFLTINLPKDHHVEITLDYFDIFKYQNCLADFLEIQEYKEDVSGIYNKNLLKQRRSMSLNNNTNKQIVKLNKKITPNKQQRIFKWSTVALMCGKEESKHVMKASSDIINFKFRSISSNHQYFKLINNSRMYTGFKIYFQAIPPTVENKNAQNLITTSPKDSSGKNIQKSSQEKSTSKNSNESNQQVNSVGISGIETKNNQNTALIKAPSWTTVSIVLLLIILALLAILIGFALFSLKRRGLLNQQSVSFFKSSKKQAKNGLIKPNPGGVGGSVVTAASGSTLAVYSNKTSKINPKNKLPFDESDNSAKFSSTTKSETATPHMQPSPAESNKPKLAVTASKFTPQTNSVRTILEPEPRKMQAERPALLQDLDKSKLLMKYKMSIVDSKADQTPLIKPAEKEGKGAMSPDKSSLNLKLTSVNAAKNDDLSGVYTGGSNVNEDSKLISENAIYGADLVNIKCNVVNNSTPTEKINISDKKSLELTKNQTETKPLLIENKPSVTTTNETIQRVEDSNSNKMKKITLIKEPSIISNDHDSFEFTHTKLEIVEESDNQQKETSDKNVIQDSSICDGQTETINHNQQPRRSAFNPLHVILKDKNKYYTTEYI